MSKKSLAVFLLCLPVAAFGQTVISTHAGLIHFFEGSVYLGDQPLEAHLGKFPNLPQGGILRTDDGRAEVLLTPGVFLRVGQRSSIRMVANHLADTRVELQTGSAFVESGEPNEGTSVSLLFKTWRVHLLQKGIYRADAAAGRLWVREGKAEVFAGASASPVVVESGSSLRFGDALETSLVEREPYDAFNDWVSGRSQSIAADNTITAQIDEDPATGGGSLDGFTYYPMLDLGALGLGSTGIYGLTNPTQPGFNSVYLPGYTYAPVLFLQLGAMRLSGLGVSGIGRNGLLPGFGGVRPLPRNPMLPPHAPITLPHAAPVRVAPPVVAHPVIHH